MSAEKKVHINRNHPDYPEYIEKCKALGDKWFAMEEEERAKYPDWKGKDHPADTKEIYRQLNAGLKQLQAEYAHLFIIE